MNRRKKEAELLIETRDIKFKLIDRNNSKGSKVNDNKKARKLKIDLKENY